MMVTRGLLLGLALGMLTALLGGLSRFGFLGPNFPAPVVGQHGALLGALLFPGLIGLERAVAIGRWWAWGAPWLAVLGVAGVVLGGNSAYGLALALALLLLAQQAYLWRRSPGLEGFMPVLACLLLGVTDWRWGQGWPAPGCAPGWASYLILLVGAERLELSFLRGRRTRLLWPVVTCLALGVAADLPRLVGLGWLALAWWFSNHDLARHNARRTGLAAYSARSVLAGYFWLSLSGLQLLIGGLPYLAGPAFDRVLHGVFIGFVLSMVLAHGPIIFPALCKAPIRFSGWFYLPLVLLHLSLAMRCFGWREAGAAGNVLAVFLYGLTMVRHYQPGYNPFLQASKTTKSSSKPVAGQGA
ncbi:hypothetical protein JST97_33180 [bacterium]|nr:hypothetical protein [bacterium]